MTMSKEPKTTTEKSIQKNPYIIRKLLGWWLLALFWIVLIFPALLRPLQALSQTLPGALLWLLTPLLWYSTLGAIVGYSLIFLMRRKRFFKQEKQGAIETNYEESNSKRSFIWFCPLRDMTAITIIIFIAVVVFSMRIPPGLSITGTMLWGGKPAETVSVILCPTGIVPGISYLGEAGQCEKFAPYSIIDASGKYRFFNIPPGTYTIFYKWPDEDDWNLGETTKGSFLVFVKEGSITKVDPISAFRKD